MKGEPVFDKLYSGRPTDAVNKNSTTAVYALIKADCRLTITEKFRISGVFGCTELDFKVRF